MNTQEITLIPGGVLLHTDLVTFRALTSHRESQLLVGAALPATVPTHLEWSDDGPLLVAFSDNDNQELYRVLRTISGVGVRTALHVLDSGTALDALRAASAKEEVYLMQVPGIGPSKAKQVVAGIRKAYGGRLPKPLPVPVLDWVAAREQIMHLGIDEHTAEQQLFDALAQQGTLPSSE